MKDRAEDSSALASNKRTTFELTSFSTNEIRNVFDNLIEQYEANINEWISSIPDSKERTALISLSYAGLIGVKRDRKGNPITDSKGNIKYKSPKLREAILNDNRTEAWYEIRYITNFGKSAGAGIAKRRFYESELFGLYDDGVDDLSISEQEAMQVYRMYTEHREDILNYELKYGAGATLNGSSWIDPPVKRLRKPLAS